MSENLSLSKVLNSQAGWYRGDFHAHTSFSDGCHPPLELVEVARAEGLDFFAVTDHNTIEALANFGSQPDILIIPGLEVTLDEGHFNIFGIDGYSDWQEFICTGQSRIKLQGQYDTFTKVMQRVASEGLLNSINHPWLAPWQWLDDATELRYLHCLEIWNDPSWPENSQANPQAVSLWTDWLNAGYRITAIGGSDYHRPTPKPGHNKPPERLGQPSTYVYATELSGAAILEGLRRRRAYVSLEPRVTFQAQTNGRLYEIGDELGEFKGDIELKATILDCPSPAQAQIVKNGYPIAAVPVGAEPTSLQISDKTDQAQPAWFRLEVLGQNGQLWAITNPIFTGHQREPALRTYGAFTRVNSAEPHTSAKG